MTAPIIHTPRHRAFYYTAIRVILVATVALQPFSEVEALQVALPVSQCLTMDVRRMPQRIRKICADLMAIWNFNAAMENYLDEKLALELSDQYRTKIVAPNQEDLDHVFLRFGRKILLRFYSRFY